MSIGTKLFAENATRAFSKINEEISLRQALISSGKNDPRASSDPVRAARLSVAKEQEVLLDRFERNLKQVKSRLEQTDSVLHELANISQRFREIALRGASDSVAPSERTSLRIEATQLRDNLVALANARDDTGGALFGGFAKNSQPFSEQNGEVSYLGDRGRHQLRVSESAVLETGIDGGSIFMTVSTDDGMRDAFSIADDLLFSLAANENSREASFTASEQIGVTFELQRQTEDWSFDVSGPGGAATISVTMGDGGLANAVEAINAQSINTGVSAKLDSTGSSLILDAPGEIQLTNFDVSPQRRAILASVQAFDGSDQPLADTKVIDLVPHRLDNRTQPTALKLIGDHFSDRRAEAGGMAQEALRHEDTLTRRQTSMKEAIGQLEDADIARLVTELQQRQLSKNVAYQTFAAISQKSLFNYIG